MSTNFYAFIKLNQSETLEITQKLHIGKTGSSVIIQGDWFGSWDAWKAFLIYNKDKIRIEDEYSTPITLTQLIQRIEASSPEERRRQYDWVENDTRLGPDRMRNYSLDAAGYTISKGEWF